MNRPDGRDLEILALRDRLTRMCEACHRINESLDAVLGYRYRPGTSHLSLPPA